MPRRLKGLAMNTDLSQLSPAGRRAAVALAWLVGGCLLLAFTPLSSRSAALGWTPAFWLVFAPTSILLALKPTLPLRLLAAVLRR